MGIGKTLNRLRRRWFGSYTIDDPRPIAEASPYTYHLPSENEVLALAPGDIAKIVIRSVPAGREWEAERMWVTITSASIDTLTGELSNTPLDMPQLRPGDVIHFRRSDVIHIQWNVDRLIAPPSSPARREYWDRCMVDDCVVEGRSPVDNLYREVADMAQPDDEYPDSGWRIRGTDDAIAADQDAGRQPIYIAIAKVLNKDDSWLGVMDAPTGSKYIRDLDSDRFVAVEDQRST